MTEYVKTKAADWLYQQGVSTVLLFLIFGAICYAGHTTLPKHLEQIQKGYQQHALEINKAAEQMNKAIDRVTTAHEKDRDMFFEIMFKHRAENLSNVNP